MTSKMNIKNVLSYENDFRFMFQCTPNPNDGDIRKERKVKFESGFRRKCFVTNTMDSSIPMPSKPVVEMEPQSNEILLLDDVRFQN